MIVFFALNVVPSYINLQEYLNQSNQKFKKIIHLSCLLGLNVVSCTYLLNFNGASCCTMRDNCRTLNTDRDTKFCFDWLCKVNPKGISDE